MAELADALDSKSSGKPCGFESHHRYHNNLNNQKVGLEKERAKFRLVKARLNAGKNSPVNYFCDASASGPAIGTLNKQSKDFF